MKKSVVAVLTAVGTGVITAGAIIVTKGAAKKKALEEMIKTNEKFDFDKDNVKDVEYQEQESTEEYQEQESTEKEQEQEQEQEEENIVIDDSDIDID